MDEEVQVLDERCQPSSSTNNKRKSTEKVNVPIKNYETLLTNLLICFTLD